MQIKNTGLLLLITKYLSKFLIILNKKNVQFFDFLNIFFHKLRNKIFF